jgi:hypothetical protein
MYVRLHLHGESAAVGPGGAQRQRVLLQGRGVAPLLGRAERLASCCRMSALTMRDEDNDDGGDVGDEVTKIK